MRTQTEHTAFGITNGEDIPFTPYNFRQLLDRQVGKHPNKCRGKECWYLDIPVSFDIEVSSFYECGEKRACMYIWSFAINGKDAMYGRTWNQFFDLLDILTSKYKLDDTHRVIIFVHNLGYEFQFLRHHMQWKKVFSMDTRKPLYANNGEGVEFRCSYLLSGYSLANLSKQLTKYKVEKMVGDLDYNLIRHSTTPLTDKEIRYSCNDVRVVIAYIQERIEEYGNIAKLELTKTGFVRTYCRNMCYRGTGEGGKHTKSPVHRNYRELMKHLMITSKEEFLLLNSCFYGGYTHANVLNVDKVFENVGHVDFTSSYPFCMVAKKFPMGRGERVETTSQEQFLELLEMYCCAFIVEFRDIHLKEIYGTPLSCDRAMKLINPRKDNGRLVSADVAVYALTELDFFTCQRYYEWDKYLVEYMYIYPKGYLPTNLVKAVLHSYKTKTELKGVEGKEVEYLAGKERTNSIYGMCVTNPCRDEIIYDTDWTGKVKPDYNEALRKYNDSRNRFLYYPWGVWVTAHARYNLFTGINETQFDNIYNDTDSMFILNTSSHLDYFKQYNEYCIRELDKAMDYHGLPHDMYKPKTIKGVEKPLGVWDFEPTLKRFKTLGCKRYMYEDEHGINITVSGLNKKIAMKYISGKWGGEEFKHFTDGMYIPAGYTGKNTHVYIDEETSGVVTDYMGNDGEYHELSSTYMEPSFYDLSVSQNYIDYMLGVQEYEK